MRLAKLACVYVCLGVLLAVGVCEPQAQGPDGGGAEQLETKHVSDSNGQCSADEKDCSPCTWTSEQGITYSLEDFNTKQFQMGLQNLRGSSIKFFLCPTSTLNCNNEKSQTCLNVPGIKPTRAGSLPRVEQLQPNVPGQGFQLILEEGEICEVTKQPRVTVISLPCNPITSYKPQHVNPRRAYEGQKTEVCRYYVEFPPTQFACPVLPQQLTSGGLLLQSPKPEIWAVSGCSDSTPLGTTSDCHFAVKTTLSLHGLNFDLFCSEDFVQGKAVTSVSTGNSNNGNHGNQAQPPRINTGVCTRNLMKYYGIYVGPFKCKELRVVSHYIINCTLDRGKGKDLDIMIKREMESSKPGNETLENGVVAMLEGAVTFKEAIDFREKFSKFIELGVGGLKREIEELYRRAFASRGTAPDVLQKLGISHIKGILLYGPPGSGKTLLARTIANILGTKQVQLINGPEIISKFLGESEKNLRDHFKVAQDAWKAYGPLSDLYVIIIDEIDAICKPRGKSDQSAAGAEYDALVNQLLTLMDGLNEAHNILVIGLTNRRELLDPALLRPGRFEVQIEVTLPDEQGRWEIFEIHTRSMRGSGLLSPDVDLWELTTNTTRFSGAEIAGVVRAAASYALDRYQQSGQTESVVVSSMDFQQAIRTISPAYTHSETHVLSNYLPLGYLPCGSSHEAVVNAAVDLIHTLRQSSSTRMQTLLLYGPRGSGKTTLAAHLAVLGKFTFTKILAASALVGRHDVAKVDLLFQTFNDAFRSKYSIVVLDDLHRLVEYVQVGAQVTISHSLLHAITTLLTTTPPAGSKVLVVGTMIAEDSTALEEHSGLGLPELFMRHHYVPLLNTKSVLTFLGARNMHRAGGGQFSLPSNLVISVRQLLHAIECACAQSNTPCSTHRTTPSHMRQDSLLDCIMAFVTKQTAEITTGPGM